MSGSPPLAVGVAGVGSLGDGIARSLLRAGYPVGFLDPRPEAGTGLVELGGRRAATLADLAAQADAIHVAVVDDGQVREVVDGIAAVACPGLTVIVHSTVAPATMQAVAERLRPLGVAVLDAPVSGGPEKAQSGLLTIMLGGEKVVVERCRPLLETIGDEIFHLGPVGTGAVAKLANQLMLYGNWVFVGQALGLASACGIDDSTMRAVARAATADSWALRNWDLLGERFGEVIAKDVELALAIAARAGVDVEAARRVTG